jgi:hypothetical protein
MRSSTLFLVAALLAAVVAPASASAASCRDERGKEVRRTSSLRIVARVTPATKAREALTTYYGCALPSRTVRRLGYTGGTDTGRTSAAPLEGRLAVIKVAGPFVLVRQFTQQNEAGEQTDTRVVIDVRSGAKREVWRFRYLESTLCDEDFRGQPKGPYLPRPKQFVLGANGVVAGVYAPIAGDKLADCFTPTGTALVLASVPGRPSLRELDRATAPEIPSRSLTLRGRTVGWTRSGERRSAAV